jgi:hypothetical protein
MAAARGCSFAARAPAATAATIKHRVSFPSIKVLQIFSLKHIISILSQSSIVDLFLHAKSSHFFFPKKLPLPRSSNGRA